MKKFFIYLFALISFASVQLTPALVLAGEESDLLGISYGQETGLTRTDPRIVVARIIQVSLGLLGTVALVIIIYAGFEWMTAGGESEKIDSSKSRILAAVMGLVIILSAYALTAFVVKELYRATTNYTYIE